jgi:hypothetical protein
LHNFSKLHNIENTLESYTQIGQTEAVGQLGIDEESLLMLLVA